MKFIDLEKIVKTPQIKLKREQLISDLIERFELSDNEKLSFLTMWGDLEKIEIFHEGKSEEIIISKLTYVNNKTIELAKCLK